MKTRVSPAAATRLAVAALAFAGMVAVGTRWLRDQELGRAGLSHHVHHPELHAGEDVVLVLGRVHADTDGGCDLAYGPWIVPVTHGSCPEPGETVTVRGTWNADGSVTATDLLLHPDRSQKRLLGVVGVAVLLTALALGLRLTPSGVALRA